MKEVKESLDQLNQILDTIDFLHRRRPKIGQGEFDKIFQSAASLRKFLLMYEDEKKETSSVMKIERGSKLRSKLPTKKEVDNMFKD